jgi:hypothetical protein
MAGQLTHAHLNGESTSVRRSGLAVWAARQERSGRALIGAVALAATIVGCYGAPEIETPSPGASSMSVPSPLATGSTPTEPSGNPVVETNVVDRPGVPAALYDKYWAAHGQVGQVGTTARIEIPSGEWILASDAGRVVTHAANEEGDPIIGEGGVELIVRDVRTGMTVRSFTAQTWVTDAILVGSTMIWTGYELPFDPFDPVDAGVFAINVADGSAAPVSVVPPSDLRDSYGSSAVRGLLRRTDQGTAVVTLIEGEEGHATEIIDVASMTLRMTIEDEFAIEVAGSRAILAPLHRDSGNPDSPARVRLVDLSTGAEMGSGIGTRQVVSSFLGGDEAFIQFNTGGESRITAIDLETGEPRSIFVDSMTTESLELSHRLSAVELLVLLPVDGAILDSNGSVHLSVSLLDPSGELRLDAFEIGNP